jgi:cytochrome bd ubiquinol oxidase subunit I
MLTSLIVLTLLYGVLAVIEVRLMITYIARGADQLPEPPSPDDPDASTDKPLAFAY